MARPDFDELEAGSRGCSRGSSTHPTGSQSDEEQGRFEDFLGSISPLAPGLNFGVPLARDPKESLEPSGTWRWTPGTAVLRSGRERNLRVAEWVDGVEPYTEFRV